MNKRRIIWIAILLILALNMIFSQSMAGIYLLLGALLIPGLSILAIFLGVKEVDAQITLPKTCGKKQLVKGRIEIASPSLLPVFKGEIEVDIKNILTTEDKKVTLVTGFSKKKETLNFVLENAHCGATEVFIGEVAIYDPLGLWKKVLKPEVKTVVTVLPDTFPLHLELVHGNLSDNDSIEYAQGKTGNDISEIFGIREYQEGDSIGNIHWKLSSKCDDLMVKLPSLPLENSILLLLETGMKDEGDCQPDVFDALAEIYITISQTLVDNEISHKVAWYDQKTKNIFTFQIDDEDDLHGIMTKTLATERAVDKVDTVSRFIQEAGHVEQAHLVYVTHRDEGYLEQVPADIIKTAVICSDKEGNAGGVMDYSCSSEDYPQQLRSMTI